MLDKELDTYMCVCVCVCITRLQEKGESPKYTFLSHSKIKLYLKP